jgi:hypothetical protein
LGKQYLLEIEVDGKQYSAITALLQSIPIDSLTSGNYFKDEEKDTIITKARLTVHFPGSRYYRQRTVVLLA